MPPDPLDLACFVCQIVCSAYNYHVHYNVFVRPPFVNPGSAPDSIVPSGETSDNATRETPPVSTASIASVTDENIERREAQ